MQYMNYPNQFNPQFYQPQQYAPYPVGVQTKMVNDFNEISASDVSMNGQPSIFLKNDLSEICLRKWENNGTISNLAFKPVLMVHPNNSTNGTQKAENDPFKTILDRLQELSDKVDRMAKPNKVRKEIIDVEPTADNQHTYEQ